MQETWVRSLGQEDPLEKEMATHSSILAWRIPWTEETGGLQRVQHDWVTSLSAYHKSLQNKIYFSYYLKSKPAVPNLFGARDQFHGRQYFHWLRVRVNSFRMIQMYYMYCALYF